jgi:hypothetical protein
MSKCNCWNTLCVTKHMRNVPTIPNAPKSYPQIPLLVGGGHVALILALTVVIVLPMDDKSGGILPPYMLVIVSALAAPLSVILTSDGAARSRPNPAMQLQSTAMMAMAAVELPFLLAAFAGYHRSTAFICAAIAIVACTLATYRWYQAQLLLSGPNQD